MIRRDSPERRGSRGWLLFAGLVLGAPPILGEEAAPPPRGGAPGLVNVVTIDGSINPASADYIKQGIAKSEREGAAALLVELDTPGGLVSSTKDIIQAMLNARVPVIVYVAPQGAWAGSAGTFITIAGHVAAMAPGTTIGAAHPVGVGGGGGGGDEEEQAARNFALEKAENMTAAFIESIAKERKRNVEWAVKAVRESVAIAQDEALELGVIDIVAQSRTDLLAQIEGRSVVVAGEERELALVGARFQELRMTWANRFLNVLATPDVAILLILAGMLGLYVEFTQPGVIFPGVAGAIALILGMIALQILPFSWYGLLLLLIGIGLFVAELFVTSYGLLFAAGVACFLLGGSMIFDVPELSDLTVSFWTVLVPTVGGLALFAALVIFLVGRTFTRPQVAGVGEMVGMIATTATELGPEGTVFVHGEHWRARAEESIGVGERVEIMGVEGLVLRVRRAPPAS